MSDLTEAQVEAIGKIRNDLSYHKPPNAEEGDKITKIRTIFFQAACALIVNTPPGRDQAIAYTHLEEAMRAANAAIAKKWPIAENL